MLKTGRMASSSYTALFFPCSENGSNVDPTDVIRGAVYPPGVANSGDGTKITQGIESGSITISAGSFPTISATQSFMVFFVADPTAIPGGCRVNYGDASASEYIWYNQFGTGGVPEMQIVTSDSGGTVSVTAIEQLANAPQGISLALDRGNNLECLYDGVVKGSVADPGGSLNPAADEMTMSHGDFYGLALFIFDDGLPSDYKEASAWMASRWAVGQKVIWPAWEIK